MYSTRTRPLTNFNGTATTTSLFHFTISTTAAAAWCRPKRSSCWSQAANNRSFSRIGRKSSASLLATCCCMLRLPDATPRHRHARRARIIQPCWSLHCCCVWDGQLAEMRRGYDPLTHFFRCRIRKLVSTWLIPTIIISFKMYEKEVNEQNQQKCPYSVQALSHTRTVCRECFKGDEASQWKGPKFDPSPHQNPLTDLHKHWQAWLRPGRQPACTIL